MLDIGREVAAAGGTSQNVGGAKVHQAMLAKGVTTSENSRDLLFIVVVVKTYWAGDFHAKLVKD